jgi:hypothetical protein
MYTGPHLIKDNLVFGYDTGYGVADNNTSTRFYPGEPTVNSLASTAFGSSGITLGSDSGGTYLETNSGTTGYNYIKVPNITVSSNETYTWSFELKSTETITQSGNKYYFDQNEHSNEFSTSNDNSRVSASQVRPSSLPANEWVKFALTITMKANLTGAYSYDFLNFIKPHFTSKKIYYRNMQFEHNKSHHTPFVAGTRSSTQSLIDLKRSTDINVATTSFDSTGQPTLDGTDDYIYPNNITNGSGLTSITAEFVVKASANNKNIIKSNSNAILLHYGGAGFYLNSTDSTTSGYLGWNNKLSGGTGVYEHLVATYDGTTMKLYVNGESTGTTRAYSAGSTGILKDLNGVTIGGNFNSSQPYFNGDIPIAKIHNRALTAGEVKQNYNAYKNRFDI